MATYKNTLAEDITNYLKTYLGSTEPFGGRVYYGNRPNVPKDQLPCITVGTVNHSSASGATQTDLAHYVVEIRLMFDKRAEFDKSPNDVVLQKTMENAAFGRDNTTNEYSVTSIYGILRKYLTLGSRIVNSSMSTVVQPNVDRPDTTLAEAIVTFEADERVVVQRTTT